MATANEHMDGTARPPGVAIDETLRHKAGQMQKFLDDVEELLGRVSGMDEPDIARLRHKVEASIQRVKSGVRDGTQSALKSTREAMVATDEYVHRKPWIAIGASAAIGLLLGALLRGGRRD
jgi:ElaB/YqjD/DUF883 family membrane-anchored ribosome-binding protein